MCSLGKSTEGFGSPGQCTESLWKSRAVNGSLGDSTVV